MDEEVEKKLRKEGEERKKNEEGNFYFYFRGAKMPKKKCERLFI